MQKILFISMIAIAMSLSSWSYAEPSADRTLAELVENGKALDGTEVAMTVEMIGDAMNRGEFVWINGLDSTGAMGLWIPSELADQITVLGNGKFKGDTARIQGVFQRACPEHGGDMDIHVSALTLVETGHLLETRIADEKKTAAVLLTLAVLAVGGIYRKYRLS